MRIPAIIGVLAFLAGPAAADGWTRASSPAPREVAGAVFVLRGFDPALGTVTLAGETGRLQVLRADGRALRAVSSLSPGDSLLVSYRFNRNAEAEVTLRRMPAGYVPAGTR